MLGKMISPPFQLVISHAKPCVSNTFHYVGSPAVLVFSPPAVGSCLCPQLLNKEATVLYTK